MLRPQIQPRVPINDFRIHEVRLTVRPSLQRRRAIVIPREA
jgi:hypothetical protein